MVANGTYGGGVTICHLNRCSRAGKAPDLHLTATCAFTWPSGPVSRTREREGGGLDGSRKRRIEARKKHLFSGFLWLKGPAGVVKREKKTRRTRREEQDSQRSLLCCFFLKRNASLGEERENSSEKEREGGKAGARRDAHRYDF